jgi:hypothetical protein
MPLTAEEALAWWDAGKPVFTLELGGLGPGYEQCIHVLVFELIRKFKDEPLHDDNSRAYRQIDAGVSPIDNKFKLELSGAQVGAAINFTLLVLREGWAKVVNLHESRCDKCGGDRFIQVSRAWPGRPPAPAAAAEEANP